MKRTTWMALIVSAAASIPAAPAVAQNMSVGLRGLRVEANAGGSRYTSVGRHKTKFGYGATVGADFNVSNFVVGAEGTYWRDSKHFDNCLTGSAGTLCNSVGRELGAAVRAGVLIQPQLLAFAKAGYVNVRERDVFSAASGLFVVNGVIGPGPDSFNNRRTDDGYQLGAGLEYSLMSRLYVDGQYVYSHYSRDRVRNRVMLGVGYRF